MRTRRQKILDTVAQHLYSTEKTARLAATTVILKWEIFCWHFSYSVDFINNEDEEGRVQAISALS
jgi:hypothetical protein